MTCPRCAELEAKLNEAILTYSPYVKALKEAVAKVEKERDKALADLHLHDYDECYMSGGKCSE